MSILAVHGTRCGAAGMTVVDLISAPEVMPDEHALIVESSQAATASWITADRWPCGSSTAHAAEPGRGPRRSTRSPSRRACGRRKTWT